MISEADARLMIRLVADVASGNATPEQRRRKLMCGLAELVGASGWLWVTMRRDFAPDGHPAILRYLHDLPPDVLAAAGAAIHDRDDPLDMDRRLRELSLEGRQVTLFRSEMISDDDYLRQTAVVKYPAFARVTQSIFAVVPLPSLGVTHVIPLHRIADPNPFTERERVIADAILREVPWLHRLDITDGDSGAARLVPHLTARQRLVLFLLTDGMSPSAIAAHLNLSVHTVNDHLKAIYRHFRASSRPELLARFMGGGDARS